MPPPPQAWGADPLVCIGRIGACQPTVQVGTRKQRPSCIPALPALLTRRAVLASLGRRSILEPHYMYHPGATHCTMPTRRQVPPAEPRNLHSADTFMHLAPDQFGPTGTSTTRTSPPRASTAPTSAARPTAKSCTSLTTLQPMSWKRFCRRLGSSMCRLCPRPRRARGGPTSRLSSSTFRPVCPERRPRRRSLRRGGPRSNDNSYI